MNYFHKVRYHANKPSISILLPVFQAHAFICETLDSLANQVCRDFQILISIDKSNDGTEHVTKKWYQEHKNIKAKIFNHKDRLGWVQNINFLLDKCNTKYFMVMPHDDTLHEFYIQKMIQCLRENPKACTAFSDIQGFGLNQKVLTQYSITGNRLERTIEFLNGHCNAVAFRGLVNRNILSDFILMPENNCSNFGIDTVWNLQMALQGELIRVPEVLYHKRFCDDSVHDKWQKLESKDKTKVWLAHCTDCLKVICSAGFEHKELEYLIEVTLSRLLQEVHPFWAHKEILNLNDKERVLMVRNLLEKTITSLGDGQKYILAEFLKDRT